MSQHNLPLVQLATTQLQDLIKTLSSINMEELDKQDTALLKVLEQDMKEGHTTLRTLVVQGTFNTL